ncbi:MAG: NOP5/NOP56 family protein [Natronomonas sp.]
MNEKRAGSNGWFEGIDPGDEAAAVRAIQDGRAEAPAEWPSIAVESGFTAEEADYYDRLHEVTTAAARSEATRREAADDQQLKHTVRALDDTVRIQNELTERVTEWANSHPEAPDGDGGMEHVRAIVESETGGELGTLSRQVLELETEAMRLRAAVERDCPSVAPNLAAMAGPVLAARLIALAGGLESLAKKPSGTVQVLGAEEALFAHLRGHAPSPKHGIIATHEAIQGTPRQHRGSAARALAGKLTIAARVDHYSGERKPELDEQLRERIETIRERDSA